MTKQIVLQKDKINKFAYHIIVNGFPVSERHWKLAAASKTKIYFVLDNGICRPCSSPWASSIHMVHKEKCYVFTTLDLVKAYYQVPMNKGHIQKTASLYAADFLSTI